ncbi:MAG: (d)CMP kinase [Eubacteriales bacterium]
MKLLHIAIDGPAGAGKSTIARILAKKLDINYLDTGAMYRAVTYHVLFNHIDIHDYICIINETKRIAIDFINNEIFLNGKNINQEIRSIEVNNHVSSISAIPEVREILVSKQQEIAMDKSVVMDGRDIATVVLPFANFKFYLDASIEVRVKRRFIESMNKGIFCNMDQLKKDMSARDNMDQKRKVSPLKKSQDAIVIDTSNQSVEDITNKMVDIIHHKED